MRVVFPKGGSWEIYPENEEGLPYGLYYYIWTDTDAGYMCAIIMYNIPDEAYDDLDTINRINESRLVIKNTESGYQKWLKCTVMEDGSMGIKVEDE
ncbi:MAG: hypothetical protein J6Y71_07320 [Ruminococcus sp.]|nr:hypothetical protein [Ruminococcus sp.]